MPLTTIEPRRLYQQVAEQLRAMIDAGEYPSGSRLPAERELALQLGISRPTVREALIALEVDGRVRIRVGSGIYVQPQPIGTSVPSATTRPLAGPFEILDARAVIESAVAEQAAGCVTTSHIATLDVILTEMTRTLHPGPRSIALDRAFHIAIAAMLGNDAITKVVVDLFDQRVTPCFAKLASHFEDAASWRAATDEHQALRNRLAVGDGLGARTAMREHLDRSKSRFSKTFGDAEPASLDWAGAETAQRHAGPTTGATALDRPPKTRRKRT